MRWRRSDRARRREGVPRAGRVPAAHVLSPGAALVAPRARPGRVSPGAPVGVVRGVPGAPALWRAPHERLDGVGDRPLRPVGAALGPGHPRGPRPRCRTPRSHRRPRTRHSGGSGPSSPRAGPRWRASRGCRRWATARAPTSAPAARRPSGRRSWSGPPARCGSAFPPTGRDPGRPLVLPRRRPPPSSGRLPVEWREPLRVADRDPRAAPARSRGGDAPGDGARRPRPDDAPVPGRGAEPRLGRRRAGRRRGPLAGDPTGRHRARRRSRPWRIASR